MIIRMALVVGSASIPTERTAVLHAALALISAKFSRCCFVGRHRLMSHDSRHVVTDIETLEKHAGHDDGGHLSDTRSTGTRHASSVSYAVHSLAVQEILAKIINRNLL